MDSGTSEPSRGFPPSTSAREACGFAWHHASFSTTSSGEIWRFTAFVLLLLCTQQIYVEGTGTAQFGNGRAIDTDASLAEYVSAADLDGDGDQDVLLCSYWGDYVRWYENEDGRGAFSGAVNISTDSDGGGRLAVGDLDGDGFPEVVVVRHFDDKITWFKNLDGEAFTVGGDIDTVGPSEVKLADLDGDGHLDVISTAPLDGAFADVDLRVNILSTVAECRVTWFKNVDGEGTYDVGLDISTTSDGASRVVMVDVDGDGMLDVALASSSDGVEWFKNSNGVFSLGVEMEQETPAVGAIDIAAADFDGDGNVDVVTASFDEEAVSPVFPSGRLILFKNDGAGSFEVGKDIGLLDSVRSVIALDLDNDEDFDILASDYSGGRIVWYENNGHGNFSTAIDIAVDFGVTRVIAADLDGDGDLDLVSSNLESARLVWYENLLIDITPAPLPATTQSPDQSAAETSSPPTPSSVISPTNPVQTPAPSIDATPESTPAPADGPNEDEPAADTDSGSSDSSMTDEILIGVVTTVASAALLGAARRFKLFGGTSAAPPPDALERDPPQSAAQ